MNNDVLVWGLLLLALFSANLPFINNRLYLIRIPAAGAKKPVWLRLLELVVLYFVIGAIGLLFEHKLNGQIHAQDWEFYAITFFMFVVFAFPGFIYRYTFQK